MSAEREKMIAALKEHVVPLLKARGFKGSFPHYRRLADERIHLLTFQFSRWGGEFVVEVASCPPEGVTAYDGEKVPPNKVRAHDVSCRLRLGSTQNQVDHWFKFDRGSLPFASDPFERAAREVLPYLDGQAESYWSSAPANTNEAS